MRPGGAAGLFAAVVLSACSPASEETAAPQASAPQVQAPQPQAPRAKAMAPAAEPLGRPSLPDDALSYRCANGERLRAAYPSADVAIVQYRGEVHRLTIARSASGARYTDATLQWWTKGRETGTVSRLAAGESIATEAGAECRLEVARTPAPIGQPPGPPTGSVP